MTVICEWMTVIYDVLIYHQSRLHWKENDYKSFRQLWEIKLRI
jgi:hypothetical protein